MSAKDQIAALSDLISTTIATGQSLSGAIDTGGMRAFSINVPSTFTGTVLTFLVSRDGGATYQPKYMNGAEYQVQVPASTAADISIADPNVLCDAQFFKIRSGTAASPVVQASDASLKVSVRNI